MKLTEAADLIQRGYDGTLGSRVRKTLNKDGVQAYLLKDGTLVLPGTNEKSDWRLNLNVGRIDKGDSGRIWHQGFLKHANRVYTFAKPLRPKRVLGHSLGAGSAQIIGVSMGIPAICFASPKPLRGKRWYKGEHRVLNICRRDDPVTKMPPDFMGFRHVGKVYRISITEAKSLGNHNLAAYLRAMANGRANPALPANWG